MQRGVLLGAGAVVLLVTAGLVLRGVTRQQAGQAVDANISELSAYLPPGTAIQHGPADYNPITGTLTVHNVAMGVPGNGNWTADTVTISGAHPDLLRDVFDPAAYPGGRPAWTDRRLLLETATAHNLHFTDPASQLTWKSVVLHHLSGRPFSLPPTLENRAHPAFGVDAALDFAADSVAADDLVLAAGGPKTVTVSLAALKLGHYDSGRLGSLALNTLELQAQTKPGAAPLHLTAQAFSLDGLDVHGLLVAKQAGHMDSQTLSSPTYASAELSQVAATLSPGPALSIGDFRVDNHDVSGGIRDGVGKLRAMTLGLGDSPVPPSMAPGLAAFGMSAITMDIDATSRNEPASGHADVTEDVTLRDLGKLHVQASVSGLSSTAAAPGNPLGPVMAASIDHATITWEDASLTDRVLKVAAAQMHASPDLVRAQLAMPVVALGVMVPDQPDAADQVNAFLAHPHRLTVTLNPPQKVSLAEVSAAPVTQRAHLLGVRVVGN